MANQENFKTEISKLYQLGYDKFKVSRVFSNALDSLLEIEYPSVLSENVNVEINLYTLSDNALVFNTIIFANEESALYTRTLQYKDGQARKLLFIDFSKTGAELPIGQYQAVFNFFVDEVGSYVSRSLYIDAISPSRKEIQLTLSPQYETEKTVTELVQFSHPQINSEWVSDAIKQIFNQPARTIPSNNTTLTLKTLESYIPEQYTEILDAPSTSEVLVQSVASNTQKVLDVAYGFATQSLEALSQSRYTEDVLVSIISSSLSKSFTQYVQTSEFTLL